MRSPEPDVLARYRGLLGEAEFAEMLAALAQPLPQAVRVNPLKVDPQKGMADWRVRYGWQAQPVSFCPTGWQILAADTPPSATIEFHLGQYYIQDAASMLPAELLDFSILAEPLILDLAAAPGGKTTHLISRSGDCGLTLANDSGPGRIAALRSVLRDWGAINTAITNYPGERFGSWYPETFDRVLLDAPCSMENLRPSGTHPRRFTTEREREGLAQRQLRLLVSALQAVKVGGQVLYSTCTLAPEEDEAVLDELLKRYPHAVRVEDISARLSQSAPGLAADETHSFNPVVRGSARLWPHRFGSSGFFAGLLTKTDGIETDRQEPPTRALERSGWTRLNEREQGERSSFFNQEYGFDLRSQLEGQALGLWRHGEGVFALPEAFLVHFFGLPVEAIGLLVGEESAQGFVVAHEWAARFGRQFTRGTYQLTAQQVAGWLRGEDVQGAPGQGYSAGKTVLVEDEDGRILGRGKIQALRLKNLLPRRLV